MKPLQKLVSWLTKLLLNHRWLIVLLLGASGASVLLFEVLEHWGEENAIDAHYVREVLFFGVAYPVAAGILLNLLLRTQEERNTMRCQQAWQAQLQKELSQVINWDELLQVVANFAQSMVPLAGAALSRHMPESATLEPVATLWLVKVPEVVGEEPAGSVAHCGVGNHPPECRLHPFLSQPFPAAAILGYCLPLWNQHRFVGLLHLYLPNGGQLQTEQISLFNYLASSLALAMDKLAIQKPEFLQVAAARHEREQVARRLHEVLAQQLSYLRLKLNALTAEVPIGYDPAVYQDLERMRDTANEACEHIRQMTVTPQPGSLYNLAESLLAQAELVSQRANLTFEHQIQGAVAPVQVHPFIQHKILSIFREALANIERYAQASRVTLTMTWSTASLKICLLDDGVGFDAGIPPDYGHFGIRVMRRRAEEIRAQLLIKATPGSGTQVVLHYTLGNLSHPLTAGYPTETWGR